MGGFTCCVPGCYNRSSSNNALKFHRFPQNRTLRHKWIKCINRKSDNSNSLFKPDSRSHRVCSSHFVGGVTTAEESVPTVFPMRARKSPTKRTTRSAASAAKPLSPVRPTEQQYQGSVMQQLVTHGLVVPDLGAQVELPQADELPNVHVSVGSGETNKSDHAYSYPATFPETPTKQKLQQTIYIVVT